MPSCNFFFFMHPRLTARVVANSVKRIFASGWFDRIQHPIRPMLTIMLKDILQIFEA